MKDFFDAKKIAVIGAAREDYKVGHIVFKNLLANSRLRVFPVNPKAPEILGVKCFSSILEIPYPVDLAVISIKAELIPQALEECGRKEVKNVVIISAGFAEAGNLELDKRLREVASKYNIKVIGPNILGIINTFKDMNASFYKDMPEKGSIAFVSQSGALGTAVLDRAIQKHLGLSSFISLGNMMNYSFIDALKFLEQDPYTEVIMIYVESLKPGTGREFIEICKRISQRKKIIALKSGKTKEGEKAAKTHTASLSSPSKIYSGAFKQAGIIEAESVDEMFRLAEIFSRYKNLGKKACIITNAGGLGVLAVDALTSAGIQLVEIPESILKEFDGFIPHGYSRRNPLDILGDSLADRYEKVLRMLERQNLFDFFVVIVSPQAMTQGKETAEILTKVRKPVFACFIGGKSFEQSLKILEENKIMSFKDVNELKILEKV